LDVISTLSGRDWRSFVSLRSKTPAGEKPRIFYGWYLVSGSWVMFFLPNAVSFGIFFKPILDEFGWSRTTLSLAQTIPMLAVAAATPILGMLRTKSDRG
jgi:hypothetical protein